MKHPLWLCLLTLIGITLPASGMEANVRMRLNTLRFVGVHSVSKNELAKTRPFRRRLYGKFGWSARLHG
jgi:hypothetical protein